MGLSDYVRAEFLRNRGLEFVKAARALGLSNRQIIWRHVLPNSLTPVITFLPFRMSAAILALTSLDFLGLGVPAEVPSLGELLQQGKDNLDAWWIIVPTFLLLVLHDAAADLHRRRAARRVRHAQVMSATPSDRTLLSIERLCVRFGASTVVDDVSFDHRAGREVRARRRVGLGQVDHRAVGAAPGRRRHHHRAHRLRRRGPDAQERGEMRRPCAASASA
jgi:hypothetical protein